MLIPHKVFFLEICSVVLGLEFVGLAVAGCVWCVVTKVSPLIISVEQINNYVFVEGSPQLVTSREREGSSITGQYYSPPTSSLQ